MKLSEEVIEQYMNLWMSLKPYISTKEKYEACQKFLKTLNEIIDIDECADELVGYDGLVDKVLRNDYIEYTNVDDDYNEDDGD
jgi:hypothetical protein